MYWIESMKDGSCIAGVQTYEEALLVQHKKYIEEGIDTYIVKG